MELTAGQIAKALGGTVEGNPDVKVSSFARIEHGRPGAVSFYANPKYEQYVYTSKASVLLVNSDFVPKEKVNAVLVRVDDAYAGVASLLKLVSDKKKKYRSHRAFSTAWTCGIALSARLGRKVWVGDYVKIGRKARIGDCSIIHSHVTVGDGVRIGHHCILYPGVVIYPGCVIGDNVILHAGVVIGSDGFGNAPLADGTWQKIEHLGNVVVGNDVEIGANTTVDRAEMESTVIGSGVKIDNLCQIAHNVKIGDNTVIAAQCGIAGSAEIGRNCIIAGQVGVVGHLKIADGTVIAAQSGVTHSIRKEGTTIMGSPAMDHDVYLRSYAKFKMAGEEK
ncbi:MAG: UDP-3-O-(3-hydroxymyristoyl)glucosamine N-acyltransferase [Bacteroidales bacterium]|nr:UDP-3-O-(3-hydroxymyristoyl)glucosamine N-acyltransferase [Bacteroidales bacterium]